MADDAAYIGFVLVELHFPGNHSLKEKRAPLASLRDVVQRRFHASFSEVGHRNAWQLARVLIVVAASSAQQARERLDEIDRYLHAHEYEVAMIRKNVDAVETTWDVGF